MKTLLYILLITSIFTACNKNNNLEYDNDFKPTEKDSPPKTPNCPEDKLLACFSGKTNENCFTTYSDDEIQKESNHYTYLDPYEDPSFPQGFSPENYLAPIRFIDSLDEFSKKYLSKNFQYGEILQERKGSFGLVSRIALSKMQNLRNDAQKSIFPTSVYRNPYYNKSVGGAHWSRHMYGDAFDFYSPQVSLSKLKKLCIQNKASFVQVYKSHIHCDWRHAQKDSVFFSDTNSNFLNKQDVNIYQIMADRTKLKISPIKTAGKKQIYLDFPFKEDPGDLSIQWSVQSDKSNYSFDGNQISLNPGNYKININIGESIYKKFDLKIK